MGHVSITALRSEVGPEPQNKITTPEGRARTQSLVSAVQVINEAGALGPNREVTYSTDSATKKMVVRVVDKQSRDVIVQWPSDFTLQMAEQYQKTYTDK